MSGQLIQLPNGATAYRHSFGECNVLVSQDEMKVRGVIQKLYHMSISHPRRYPTWDEIRDARYKFCPLEITMAMLLPPLNEYVNVHPNCFHLHEIEGEEPKP